MKLWSLIVGLLCVSAVVGAELVLPPPPPRAALERSLREALAYMRQAQNEDGSYGARQRRLQTGLAILAFLSHGAMPSQPESPIPAAAAWLLDNTSEDGFLGDSDYPMESNAVAALALAECMGMIDDPVLARRVAQRVEAALDYALNLQDKAVGADYYGGWKPNQKAKANDRRVTAWYLFFLRSMEMRGYEVRQRALDRALDFMEGSQKVPDSGHHFPREDTGGFSYDAAGLPVVSITAAGLAVMSLYERDRNRRALAVDWLARNRPIWYGPNFYYSYYFAARGLTRERLRSGEIAARERAFANRIWELLREHQNPDGSFQIPPGNAENTQEMGKSYATAMAVLVLNAGRDLMPIDATR